MRIITVNTNGIRAAERKGFFPWLAQQNADVVCIQETKAQPEQLTADVFHPEGYYCYYHSALKKGYSGVAIYSKYKPNKIIQGMGFDDIDSEGRYLEVQIGNLSVISLYLPSGSSKEERQAFKYDVMDRFMPYLQERANDGRDYVVCGDWNIAHKEIDLKNWKANQKNSGFLPEERAWMTQLFEQGLWHDAFRLVNQEADQYTWWSNRGQAWAKNVGWRIDYHVISEQLKDKVLRTSIYKDERFSDHAPLIVDYDYAL
ncbi:MAG: exodeoxyribonuclease III [Methyloprofundus sp.]|nr:exodeoxyribonuclease III [Methyloprofundus sp.]MBW6453308.1 exodeoxyribonuclease III [Methyloprofundus sp.]